MEVSFKKQIKYHMINNRITLTCLLSILLSQSCSGHPKKDYQLDTNIITDTNSIKKIKWDTLNEFVQYHILSENEKLVGEDFHFILKELAVFSYLNNSYELNNQDTTINCNATELRNLILTDTFSNKNLDCLIKINSQIVFHLRPSLLQTIFIRPKDYDVAAIERLIKRLRAEDFVQDVFSNIDTASDTVQNNNLRTDFIEIKLNPRFRKFAKANEICSQLKRLPNIENAFINDLYSGVNEQEFIYRITTQRNSR